MVRFAILIHNRTTFSQFFADMFQERKYSNSSLSWTKKISSISDRYLLKPPYSAKFSDGSENFFAHYCHLRNCGRIRSSVIKANHFPKVSAGNSSMSQRVHCPEIRFAMLFEELSCFLRLQILVTPSETHKILNICTELILFSTFFISIILSIIQTNEHSNSR